MKDIKYAEEPLGGKPWASKVQIVFGQFVFLTSLRHDLSAQWYYLFGAGSGVRAC